MKKRGVAWQLFGEACFFAAAWLAHVSRAAADKAGLPSDAECGGSVYGNDMPPGAEEVGCMWTDDELNGRPPADGEDDGDSPAAPATDMSAWRDFLAGLDFDDPAGVQ